MPTYFDSSALVAVLKPDEANRGIEVVQAFADSAAAFGTEWITPLEVLATIHRSLAPAMHIAAEETWTSLWAQMTPAALNAELFEIARTHLTKHRLRSLDAIHLAAATRIGCTRLVTFDKELAAAAKLEGLET